MSRALWLTEGSLSSWMSFDFLGLFRSFSLSLWFRAKQDQFSVLVDTFCLLIPEQQITVKMTNDSNDNDYEHEYNYQYGYNHEYLSFCQQVLLLVCQALASLLSIFGLGSILYIIILGNHWKHGLYHRILMGLSISDVVFSINFMNSPYLQPANDTELVAALPNI